MWKPFCDEDNTAFAAASLSSADDQSRAIETLDKLRTRDGGREEDLHLAKLALEKDPLWNALDDDCSELLLDINPSKRELQRELEVAQERLGKADKEHQLQLSFAERKSHELISMCHQEATSEIELTRILAEAKVHELIPSYLEANKCVYAERKAVLLDPDAAILLPPNERSSLQRSKRSALTPEGKDILRNWFEQHFHHPYPSEADKRMLSEQSGCSLDQINNWFINVRIREWKPRVRAILRDNAEGKPAALEEILQRIQAPYVEAQDPESN